MTHYYNSLPCFLCLLVFQVSGYMIEVKEGSTLELDLPSVKLCGPYTLLSPNLQPVVVIEKDNITNIIGGYGTRASTSTIADGVRFKLKSVVKVDGGQYKVAVSSMKSLSCIQRSFYVSVVAVSKSNEESLKPWGKWSTCVDACNPNSLRTRSRECSIPEGCNGMGPFKESQSCDKAEDCGHWSEWGPWGTCSAKCGKGFQVRKRACVRSNSALVDTSLCKGKASQTHMCLTICEVIGTWVHWNDWSNCSTTCGQGTRTRSRDCSTETLQREVAENCTTGNRTEEEKCNGECLAVLSSTISSEMNNSVILDQSKTQPKDSLWDDPLTIAGIAAGIACALTIIVVLLIICVLKCCCHKDDPRRPSLPMLRPATEATKRRTKSKKKSASEKKKKKSKKIESGNVYSEFASAAWPSNEFDSTYAIDNDTFTNEDGANTEDAQNAEMNAENKENTAAEEHQNIWKETSDAYVRDEPENVSTIEDQNKMRLAKLKETTMFTFDFVDLDTVKKNKLAMCDRSEVTYSKSRVCFQKKSTDSGVSSIVYNDKHKKESVASIDSDADIVVENVFYEPHEQGIEEDTTGVQNIDPTTEDVYDIVNENEEKIPDDNSIYYEPPEEIENESVEEEKYTKGSISEKAIPERDEVYANCGTIERQAGQEETSEDLSNENKLHSTKGDEDIKISSTPVPDNSNDLTANNEAEDDISFIYVDEKNGGDHMYANSDFKGRDFYVTPKYSQGLALSEPEQSSDHIYDIPK